MGKSATPSYSNAISVVSIPVSVGAGSPKVASRIGTVPRNASRSNSPPLGRLVSPMTTKDSWALVVGSRFFSRLFSRVTILPPWE